MKRLLPDNSLAQFSSSELVRGSSDPERTLAFKHALIQETAYEPRLRLFETGDARIVAERTREAWNQ